MYIRPSYFIILRAGYGYVAIIMGLLTFICFQHKKPHRWDFPNECDHMGYHMKVIPAHLLSVNGEQLHEEDLRLSRYMYVSIFAQLILLGISSSKVYKNQFHLEISMFLRLGIESPIYSFMIKGGRIAGMGKSPFYFHKRTLRAQSIPLDTFVELITSVISMAIPHVNLVK